MGKLFGPDSILGHMLTMVSDLMLLNFLWLLGCIPLVTVGASTVALYYSIEQYRNNDGIKLPKIFWNAFRSNFKQATVLWGILLLVFCVFVADILFLYKFSYKINIVLLIVLSVIAAFCLLAMGYIFPLQARFVNTITNTIKNAWLLALLHLPKSVLVATLNLLPLTMLLFWTDGFFRCMIIWLTIGVSGTAYLNNLLLRGVFKQYCKNP